MSRKRKAGMDHPELLPWHAAGTLASEESREIEEHLRECADCREEHETWSALGGALQRQDAAHISIEDLTTYGTEPGDLALDHRRRIEQHLGACAACREELDLVARLSDPAAEPPAHRLSRATWGAMAAALAGMILLGVWVQSAPEAPVIQAAQRVVLEPASRSGTAGGATATLVGGGPWVLSILLPETAPAGDYRLSLVGPDPSDSPRQVTPVVVDDNGSVTVIVRDLPPGDYVARFQASEGSFHEYRLRVASDPDEGR